MTKFCPECGKELGINVKKCCPYCGKDFRNWFMRCKFEIIGYTFVCCFLAGVVIVAISSPVPNETTIPLNYNYGIPIQTPTPTLESSDSLEYKGKDVVNADRTKLNSPEDTNTIKQNVISTLAGHWTSITGGKEGIEWYFYPNLKAYMELDGQPKLLSHYSTIVPKSFDKITKTIEIDEIIDDTSYIHHIKLRFSNNMQSFKMYYCDFYEHGVPQESEDVEYRYVGGGVPVGNMQTSNPNEVSKNNKTEIQKVESKKNLTEEEARQAIVQKRPDDANIIIMLNNNAVIDDKEFKFENCDEVYGHECYIFGWDGGNSISYVVDKITGNVYSPTHTFIGDNAKVFVLAEVK